MLHSGQVIDLCCSEACLYTFLVPVELLASGSGELLDRGSDELLAPGSGELLDTGFDELLDTGFDELLDSGDLRSGRDSKELMLILELDLLLVLGNGALDPAGEGALTLGELTQGEPGSGMLTLDGMEGGW